MLLFRARKSSVSRNGDHARSPRASQGSRGLGGRVALRGLAALGAGALLLGISAPAAFAAVVESPHVTGGARTDAALLAPIAPGVTRGTLSFTGRSARQASGVTTAGGEADVGGAADRAGVAPDADKLPNDAMVTELGAAGARLNPVITAVATALLLIAGVAAVAAARLRFSRQER